MFSRIAVTRGVKIIIISTYCIPRAAADAVAESFP